MTSNVSNLDPKGSKRPDPGAISERETGTIARAILVMRAIAEMGEASMKELADRVNLPISTMHRLLDLLGQEGVVERDEVSKTFRAGVDFYRMGALVVNRLPLQVLARPFLVEATKEAGESAYLGMLDRRALKMLFVANAASEHLLDYRVPMNVPNSLLVGASGISILAWLPREAIERAWQSESALAPESVPAPDKLAESLGRVRQLGYAHTFGQRIKGAVGLFAPVFDTRGQVCASFGFTVPEIRYKSEHAPLLAATVVKYASRLSSALGWTRGAPASGDYDPDQGVKA